LKVINWNLFSWLPFQTLLRSPLIV